jgi:suppressor for copper-sensitivity B
LKILQVETAGEFKTIDMNVRKGFIRLVIESALLLINPDVFVEGPELAIFSLPQIKLGDDGKKAVMTIPVSEEGDTKIEHTSLRFTITDGQRSITENHLVSAGSLISQPSSDVKISLLFILGLALIGGIILNLMPCVLPVLSIKILGLVAHSGATSTTIRMSFLASSLGILFSFLVIATGLIILKLTGSAVGWGIQFQEPWFIVSLTVIVSLFAYNLFGFFELNLPSWLSNIAGRPIITNELQQSFSVNFAAGSFATILATPCSAPFLGTAVGFALAGSTIEIYAVFVALGIGMALPYFLIALFPVFANWLPKPGVWMVRVKQLLGVALVATAIWLIMVLAVQSNIFSAAIIGFLMIGIGGILYTKKHISDGWQNLTAPAVLLLIIGAVFTPYYLTQRGSLGAETRAINHWVAFAPERIAKLVANGKTVFVDVTAEWCITCHVNKLAVLNRGEIYQALSKDKNVIAMRGDWTRPDQRITNYLKSFGRFGIPFNAVYGPKAKEGMVLPELLTAGIVREGLRKASGGIIFSNK